MTQRNAYVTGGTGFIGINLVRFLIQQNWNVTALHQKSSDISYLKQFPVRLAEGNITDYQSIARHFPDDIDAVFHLAGDTNLWSQKNELQQIVNVDGTRNLLRVASTFNVSAFIFTSSASAWGSTNGCTISENLPQRGGESWVNYERTKFMAEQIVRSHPHNSMKTVILNPTAVTGPYDINNWGKLFLALPKRQLPVIPNGIISVNHVDEVAWAHISAVDHGSHLSNYILAGRDCSFNTFIGKIADVMNVDKRPKPAPDFALKTVAHIQNLLSHVTGKEPDITPELVKLMTRRNISYSSQKAIDELGYNILPLEKSINDCFEWLKKEGHL